MTMQLYGTYTSPYVRHCRIALAETGLDHELVQTDYEQSARMTPTRRVPFMIHGALRLNDSAPILRYIRESAGSPFLPELGDFDLFALANTGLDTAINLFLLEKDGLTPSTSTYLQRQSGRVDDVLDELEARIDGMERQPTQYSDGQLRLGCFLGWGLFRERLTLTAYPALGQFLQALEDYRPFASTRPRL